MGFLWLTRLCVYDNCWISNLCWFESRTWPLVFMQTSTRWKKKEAVRKSKRSQIVSQRHGFHSSLWGLSEGCSCAAFWVKWRIFAFTLSLLFLLEQQTFLMMICFHWWFNKYMQCQVRGNEAWSTAGRVHTMHQRGLRAAAESCCVKISLWKRYTSVQ